MLPIDEANQQLLIRLAHEAIRAAVEGRRLPVPSLSVPPLLEPAGAFVTLKKRGGLRGCIGHVRAEKPLYRVVFECAISAAFHDSRFEPVTEPELPGLHIEISVLSPLFPIVPSEIEVGRHGLMVSMGFRRGLLLPQVAVEWNWDRMRFLEETCLKAGLPPDAWRRGASIEAFTAQIFADSGVEYVLAPSTSLEG
jgi:uncharacterized protein